MLHLQVTVTVDLRLDWLMPFHFLSQVVFRLYYSVVCATTVQLPLVFICLELNFQLCANKTRIMQFPIDLIQRS